MADKQTLDAARATFARWLSDGKTRIGVFENQDLGHVDLGRRIALQFDASLDLPDGAQAPDHAMIGLGWRYRLVAWTSTVDEALEAVFHEAPVTTR